MTDVATADEKIALRSAIESTHNGARDAIEKQYAQDKQDLEDAYHDDLRANRLAKEAALVAAGLNHDGSDPQGRQQGSVE
jgi:hypothetical protein